MYLNILRIFFVFILSTPLLTTTLSAEDNIDSEILDKINIIRAISYSTDDAVLEENNKNLNEAWTFFGEHKEAAIPVILEQVKIETLKENPHDFMLLDLGYFLFRNSVQTEHKQAAVAALFKLDPENKIIELVRLQYLRFVHAVASEQFEGILSYIDKHFLFNDFETFVPQHSLRLDADLCRVFLYGVYGKDSEAHLWQYLNDKKLRVKVLKTLAWVATDKSYDKITPLLSPDNDVETFTALLLYLISNGGQKGVDKIVTIDMNDVPKDARGKLEPMIEPLKVLNFAQIKEGYINYPGDKILNPDELLKRFQLMYDNNGRDYDTSPMAILMSEIPKDQLIEKLDRIRYKAFTRLSDEGLGDAQMYIALANALRFRDN